MGNRFVILSAFLCFSQFAIGDVLELDFQAKDISISGSLTFKPDSPLEISTNDKMGIPFKLRIITKAQKGEVAQFTYHLTREDEKQSGSVITEKGKWARVSVGSENDKDSVSFNAKWTK